jgi:hypothetical protein
MLPVFAWAVDRAACAFCYVSSGGVELYLSRLSWFRRLPLYLRKTHSQHDLAIKKVLDEKDIPFEQRFLKFCQINSQPSTWRIYRSEIKGEARA